MKSKRQKYIFIILLILSFLQEIFGEKEPNRESNPFETREKIIPRKLQADNYVTLNFKDSFISDTCWFNNFIDKISSVEIDDAQRSDYTSGISLTAENTMKIHFNSNLDELKYFLGFNSEKISVYGSNCQNSGAFTLSSHIISIDLSNLITSSVTSTSNMFSGYSSLQIVNLQGFDASALLSMDYMFSGCSSLQTIYLSELTASGVTTMEGMFNGCSSLTSVDLSQIKGTQVVENMKYMFNGCSALKLINLSNVITSNVDSSNMESIFNGCTSLVALYITNFYMSQISSTTHMFDDVNKLKYINIENMYKSHTSPSDDSPCNDVTDCVWPLSFDNHLIVCQSESRKFILDSNIFELCCTFNAEIGTCELDNYITVYYKEACTYPNGFNSFTNNFRYQQIKFINYNNSTLSDISELNILANSKIDIEMNSETDNLAYFFRIEEGGDTYDQNMLKVISIDLSHFDSSSINDMKYCFYGCKALEYVDFTNFKTENVESISFMFQNCISLKSLDLSSFNTENMQEMSKAFSGCTSL